MKRWTRSALCALLVAAAACSPRERIVVLLSTNDIHAKIQHFPRLAAAVKACRDTMPEVLLVDAGDRWTGNAYVDLAETPGMPVIALMNRIGYDVATLGNHEFDHGQAFLGRMIDSMDFEVVCANVVSDTCTFPDLPPAVVMERGGVRIGFVGAVTNYEGPGHPAGNAASFEGLRFPDPQRRAAEVAEEIRRKCDVLVLVSHMGDDRDVEFAAGNAAYDVVIGGHTHAVRDTTINGVLVTQTGKYLDNIGVTRIRLRGGEVVEKSFDLLPLGGYAPDSAVRAEVESYYADPELNRPVGVWDGPVSKVGLANWMAQAIRQEARAEVGIYHIGGVRLDSMEAGGVGMARIFDLEPFGSRVAVVELTPDQLRGLIVTKYNEQTREGHRIDLVATTPYTIVTDGKDRAVDVRFPMLREGRGYRVALSDYVFNNYRGADLSGGELLDTPVTEILIGDLKRAKSGVPDNRLKQRVEVVGR